MSSIRTTNGSRPIRPKAVSLFAGCGGFSEGIELAGFEVKCAVELDKFAVDTYCHNFPKVPLFDRDIADFLNTDEEDHRAAYALDDIDIVFRGPPCQGYSQIGTRDLKDKRNRLYEEFARVVSDLRPRMFLLENVPNLLMLNKGYYRDLILRTFKDIEYTNTTFIQVSAADHGVPQRRQRVVFLGTRDDDAFPYDLSAFWQTSLGELVIAPQTTVDAAINDLPDQVVPSGCTMEYPTGNNLSLFQKKMRLDYDEMPYASLKKRQQGIDDQGILLHNHHTKEIQERRAHLITLLKPGQKGDSLPADIWNGKRPEKWRRLHPDQPSYTILAQMHRDLSEWVHPRLNRWITVREAARLQSFHDGFVFIGSEWQQLKQIGNALPPLLAYALGMTAMATLKVLDGYEPNGAQKPSVQMAFSGPLSPSNARSRLDVIGQGG